MDKTLDFYNKHAREYICNTFNLNLTELHKSFLKHLPEKAYILDLGCGSGRDSKAFITKGYHVCAVDGSAEICKLAEEYIGQEVICKTFEEIDYLEIFDGVWACASIVHVSYSDLTGILLKISKALKSGGYLFASFKHGEFEGERDGRYYTDLSKNNLSGLLNPFLKMKIVDMFITNDVREGREREKWFNIILKKEY